MSWSSTTGKRECGRRSCRRSRYKPIWWFALDAKTGWAIRKNSPKLAAEIDDFYRNWAIKQGVVAYRMNQYMKRIKELKDPTTSADWKRFQETIAIFEKVRAASTASIR